MIVRDGKCYADDLKQVLRITSVENLGNYQLRVVFSDGSQRSFDGHKLLSEGVVFAPLADESVFNSYALDYETLTWLNGEIDISPDYVYLNSSEVRKVA